METKRIKVVMLPTEENNTPTIKYASNLGYSLCKKSYTAAEFRQVGFECYDLYFLSDDEIKEGDWCIHTSYNKSILIKIKYIEDKGKHIMTECGKNCWGDYCKKIIATTDKSLELPQPSQAFIKKYCKLGGIDKVLVKYDCISSVGLTVVDFSKEPIENVLNTPCECIEWRLKTDSHNTITIHPIKDSWSEAEVIKLISKVLHDAKEADYYNMPGFREKAKFQDDWTKENL